MKYIKFLALLLATMLLLASCGPITGTGEEGEGTNPPDTATDPDNSTTEEFDTPHGRMSGLYNASTGALKYSWEELLARGYVVVQDTVVTKSISYIRGDLYLPNTVSAVGKKAFAGCTGLLRLYTGNGVTTIGSGAFSGCTGLKEVNLGALVTNISDSAFSGCTGLDKINIPDCVTNISAKAFAGCTGLIDVIIGKGVTHIGDSAFKGCTGIRTITLGNGITFIGANAFAECKVIYFVDFIGYTREWNAITFGKNNTYITGALRQTLDEPFQNVEKPSDK